MKLIKYISKKIKKINSYNYSTLAGVIAFFFIINGGSMIFLSITFLNWLDIDISSNLANIDNVLINAFLEPILNESLRINQSISLIFIVTSLWSASTLFYQVIKMGEILYDEKRTKKGYLKRALSILLVLVFLILLLVTIIVIFISNTLMEYLSNTSIYLILRYILLLIVPLSIIMYFNVFVPPKKIPFKMLFKGIIFTILAWIIITIGLLFYINNFHSFKQIYGTLSFIIIFMLWIYLLAQGLIIGMIINHENWLKFQEENRYINA